MASNGRINLEELQSLCKRRGFIFQSSEIYGGLASCWDYGPLGVELKQNVKTSWWDFMIRRRHDVVGMDGSILMHPDVWVASGHVACFNDPMVDCKKCKARFRADKLAESECPEKPGKSPLECGAELTEPRAFNLMFTTHVGPVKDDASKVYLRPETAQAIYVNFKNIQQSSRLRVPFGIGQIGKAFRNEVTTKRFIFRSREFEQMEMQFFVPPEDDEKWFEYWLDQRRKWYEEIGILTNRIRNHEHGKDELAHYAKRAVDFEYEFPFGWQEVEGVHNRNDYDLTQHATHSKKELQYRDDETGRKYLPKIIETSSGVDRAVFMLLCDAYEEEEEQGEGHKREVRAVFRFHPKIAPVTCAVFPLSKKPELSEVAERIETELRTEAHFNTDLDVTGSIGKRYRRHDELGTPYCITIDFDSLNDQSATIRDRDSMEQIRVNFTQLAQALNDKIRNYKPLRK